MAIIEGWMQHEIAGIWANLQAWIQRQGWLRSLYRRLPLSWRTRMYQLRVARLEQQISFRQDERWEESARRAAVADEMPIVKEERFGAHAGVNIYAYARGQFGLAEGARSYARALLSVGYPVSMHDVALDVAHGMNDHSFDGYIGQGPRHDINLIFVNPDYMDVAIESIGQDQFKNRYTIACWFWELERFPEKWFPALESVDEFMVSTRFVGDTIRGVTNKPILHAPLPLMILPDSGLGRKDFGLREDSFLFLATFDFNSYLARKNPMAAIKAFRMAFPQGSERVQLLIKSSNGRGSPEKLKALVRAAAVDPRILVRDDILDRSHLQALQRCADAYVSLHRSEGFGLGIAECMRLGKPVVATAWSGNMEFMTVDNSCPVNYRLVEVGKEEYVHSVGQRWAEPDIRHAAAFMRKLVKEEDYARRIGACAATDIAMKLSPGMIAKQIIHRLEALAPKQGSR